MPRYRITDADFDEVSTVDVPANQHGLFVLAKRDNQEETAVGDYFDADNRPVDINTLAEGTLVQDADGTVFEIEFRNEPEGEGAFDGAEQRELETVGKSAFLEQAAAAGDTLFASLSKSLQEAITDDATRDAIAKAFSAQQVELSKAQQTAQRAMEIAKSVTDREHERTFIAKAATYNVPVAPETLGPVLKRMSEQMSYDDCAVIAGLLETSGDIFKQYGLDGDGGTDDVFEQVEKYMNDNAADVVDQLSKSNGGRTAISKESATVAFFNDNPSEYSALKRAR